MKQFFGWGTCVLSLAFASVQERAIATDIAFWSFNGVTQTNAPPPATGSGTAVAIGGIQVAIAAGAGSSDPVVAGDGAWSLSGFPAQGTADRTAGVEFHVSTAGYTNVAVRFDVRPSNTASRVVQLQYTVDGQVFVDGPRWLLGLGGVFTNGLVADLSGVPGIADNPQFAFRLVSAFDGGARYAAVSGNYSAAGTWRLDAVGVAGALVSSAGVGTGGSGDPEVPALPVLRYECRVLEPRRWGDAPTNTFLDHALVPGETLEIEVHASGEECRLRAEVSPGVPMDSGWRVVPASEEWSGEQVATFVLRADESMVGRSYEPSLNVSNRAGVRHLSWRVAVPTPAQRAVVLTEFLANPSGSSSHAAFNPLRRDPPSARPTQQDEFLEWVNFGSEPVDLGGWRLRDATGWRYVFPSPTVLGARQPLILHGGLPGTPPPGLDVPMLAAGEGILGLSLNNDGDVIALYDAATNLMTRVVYTADMLSSVSSLVRWPEVDGPFVAQASVSTNAVTPGTGPEGRPYRVSEDPSSQGSMGGVTVRVAGSSDGGWFLEWESRSGVEYGVWEAAVVEGPYRPIASGLRFDRSLGRHPMVPVRSDEARFYRVSRP